MKKILIVLVGLVIFVSSCEYFENLDDGLSTEEVVEGLKTALKIGADSASTSLSSENGYYGSTLLRIPLPEEAEAVRNIINDNSALASISNVIGLEAAFEDVIRSVNRAAEDAAKEATPIFVDAITDMTISDGWDILNGAVPGSTTKSTESFDSTAATQYLKSKTYTRLTAAYADDINTSLGRDLIGDVSAVDAWSTLTGKYNNFMSNSEVQLAIAAANLFQVTIDLPTAINDDLGEFSTQKALDGLFYMVGKEEKKIRKNPWQWAVDIIQKVFGSVAG